MPGDELSVIDLTGSAVTFSCESGSYGVPARVKHVSRSAVSAVETNRDGLAMAHSPAQDGRQLKLSLSRFNRSPSKQYSAPSVENDTGFAIHGRMSIVDRSGVLQSGMATPSVDDATRHTRRSSSLARGIRSSSVPRPSGQDQQGSPTPPIFAKSNNVAVLPNGVILRLDRGTDGCVLVATHPTASYGLPVAASAATATATSNSSSAAAAASTAATMAGILPDAARFALSSLSSSVLDAGVSLKANPSCRLLAVIGTDGVSVMALPLSLLGGCGAGAADDAGISGELDWDAVRTSASTYARPFLSHTFISSASDLSNSPVIDAKWHPIDPDVLVLMTCDGLRGLRLTLEHDGDAVSTSRRHETASAAQRDAPVDSTVAVIHGDHASNAAHPAPMRVEPCGDVRFPRLPSTSDSSFTAASDPVVAGERFSPVAFDFGSGNAPWCALSIAILCADASIRTICPFLPRGCRLPIAMYQSLLADARANSALGSRLLDDSASVVRGFRSSEAESDVVTLTWLERCFEIDAQPPHQHSTPTVVYRPPLFHPRFGSVGSSPDAHATPALQGPLRCIPSLDAGVDDGDTLACDIAVVGCTDGGHLLLAVLMSDGRVACVCATSHTAPSWTTAIGAIGRDAAGSAVSQHASTSGSLLLVVDCVDLQGADDASSSRGLGGRANRDSASSMFIAASAAVFSDGAWNRHQSCILAKHNGLLFQLDASGLARQTQRLLSSGTASSSSLPQIQPHEMPFLAVNRLRLPANADSGSFAVAIDGSGDTAATAVVVDDAQHALAVRLHFNTLDGAAAGGNIGEVSSYLASRWNALNRACARVDGLVRSFQQQYGESQALDALGTDSSLLSLSQSLSSSVASSSSSGLRPSRALLAARERISAAQQSHFHPSQQRNPIATLASLPKAALSSSRLSNSASTAARAPTADKEAAKQLQNELDQAAQVSDAAASLFEDAVQAVDAAVDVMASARREVALTARVLRDDARDCASLLQGMAADVEGMSPSSQRASSQRRRADAAAHKSAALRSRIDAVLFTLQLKSAVHSHAEMGANATMTRAMRQLHSSQQRLAELQNAADAAVTDSRVLRGPATAPTFASLESALADTLANTPSSSQLLTVLL